MDLEKAVGILDGTNACQFYSAYFAAAMLTKDENFVNDPLALKSYIDDLIIDIPKKVNSHRNITQHVLLDEALAILTKSGVMNTNFELTELFSLQAEITEEEGLLQMQKSLMEFTTASITKAVAVYTCPPVSFSLCSYKIGDKWIFVIIDSHRIQRCVGGNDSGIVMLVSYPGESNELAMAKVSRWIKERILTSTSKGLQSLILMKPKENTPSEVILVDDFDDIMDITDEQLLNSANDEDEEVSELQLHDDILTHITDEEMIGSVAPKMQMAGVQKEKDCYL
ncbi:uncharacterized protein LOC116297349, partial [Actinia tenebrosa]|uniref:Uncharacterized protein LOC116297349 n=1 Tax=Actinia tenebrosa TaxID=6105 RepID=A0A6P8I1N8_ACTTE